MNARIAPFRFLLAPLLLLGVGSLVTAAALSNRSALLLPKPAATAEPAAPLYKVQKVVIDAGHGGHDHGCSGAHSKEKHVALEIALKVGAYIEKSLPDVQVIYTRKTDVFVELHERAAIANRADADVFISIHCNANPNPAPYGTETYVMGLHRNEANLGVAKRENDVILLEDDYNHHYDGFDPNSPNAHIIFSLFQGAHLEQSIELAGRIEEQFSERVGRKSRGVKQAGFLVLYKTTMPAVLIETGFLTNANEENFLASDQGMDLMASAIFRAFRDYKVHTENRANINAEPVASAAPAEVSKPAAEKPAAQPVAEKPAAEQVPQPLTEKPAAVKAAPEKPPVAKENTEAPVAATQQSDKATAPTTGSPPDQPGVPLVVYRVQIYVSSRKLAATDPLFKALNGEKLYRTQHGTLYKYSVGHFSSPEEAAAKKAQLRAGGYPDAFVVTHEVANLAEN
jgi:N-acetylmuramoyl-L-alanine amidase